MGLPVDIAYTGKKYSMYGQPVDISVTDKLIEIKLGSFKSVISM